jgi:DNA-binding transcriptional regulator LsrR (DeoR family)
MNQIIELYNQGREIKQIARELKIGEGKVIYELYKKNEVGNRRKSFYRSEVQKVRELFFEKNMIRKDVAIEMGITPHRVASICSVYRILKRDKKAI